MKKIVIGADHRGFKLKEELKKSELLNKYEFIDVGCYSSDSVDYPEIGKKLAMEIQKDIENTLGIIICGSGIGVSIAVNRFSFIRGALVFHKDMVKSSRSHNNANVLALASDYTDYNQALEFIDIFLKTEFEGGRHQTRVDMLSSC